MLPYHHTNRAALAVVLVLLGFLAGLSPAEPAAEVYAPVAPAPAVHTALRDSLKTVEDWLDRKDYLSAAQSTQAVTALSQLYVYQGNDASWREKATSLADASSRLATAARNKDATASIKQLHECNRLLDDLAKTPLGDRVADKKFKLQGSNKTWMLLMDDAVNEGLSAKKPVDVEQQAGALAEEANAVQFLRSDAGWRRSFQDVRAAALDAADKAKAKDLDAAKLALKTAYQRCQACHDKSRR
jgi:hypothetical protein